jgi:proteasome accessory factor C
VTVRAQDQLERLLLALPHLADETELPLAELAERVGTDVPTLLGDLEALTTRDRDIAGFVEAVELYLGPGHVGARTAHFRRPMRLTRAEVAALDLGLGLLALERPLDERAVIDRARRQLREVAVAPPPVVRDGVPTRDTGAPALPVAVEPVPDRQLERFGRLWEAHESRRTVRLTYQPASATAADVRVVQPWAIVRAQHHVYVVGWCTTVTGMRVFRLDRIVDVGLEDTPFEVPTDFDVDAFIRNGRLFVGERPDDTLVVRFSPAIARWIAEREQLTPADDGSLTVSWPLADDDWAVRHVLQYGPDAVVLGPARIATAVQAALARLAPGS